MKCNRCGHEARVGLLDEEGARSEYALCSECWQFEELIWRIAELAKQAGITEKEYPKFYALLLGDLRDEWWLARAIDAEIAMQIQSNKWRAQELQANPVWQALKQYVDDSAGQE